MKPLRPTLLVLALLAACSEKKPGPEMGSPPPESATPTATPTPIPDPALPEPDPHANRGAPTTSRETCEKVADHLNTFIVNTLAPASATQADRDYVSKLAKARRENLIRFCVETSPPAEAECMLRATDFPSLASCERHRRQIPPELLERDYVTPEDCELFFFRLRQFKISAGTPPAEVDATKDQIVRKCEDEAKPGTLICFFASRTYDDARRCP